MKKFHVLAVVALLGAGASSAAAQESRSNSRTASPSQCAERLGESDPRGMGAARPHDHRQRRARRRPPVTLELQDVPEQQALDIVLRSVSGYLVAARETAVAGASSFDRIYILPTSSRPTNAAPLAAATGAAGAGRSR